MPSGKNQEEPKAYDPVTIAARATRYYATLFETPGAHETEVLQCINKRYDDYADYAHAFTADEVAQALAALAPGKTCGTDGIPAEVWKSAYLTDERLAPALAWTLNCRLFARDADVTTPANDDDRREGDSQAGAIATDAHTRTGNAPAANANDTAQGHQGMTLAHATPPEEQHVNTCPHATQCRSRATATTPQTPPSVPQDPSHTTRIARTATEYADLPTHGNDDVDDNEPHHSDDTAPMSVARAPTGHPPTPRRRQYDLR